ncbi:MAG: TetR/AcrR family transcriptional regulator [Actinomycetota bacterium]|nr:TetR/AcrR family transcriptional regulator [Actinomycetota bacterium]
MADPVRTTRAIQGERREDVIKAALFEFGRTGYAGTSTSTIARRAGIRQPYIYVLFENKRSLFLACHDSLNERLVEVFEEAAASEDEPYQKLRRMGIAYVGLLEDLDGMRCHLQILASAGIDDLREPVREGFEHIFRETLRISGCSAEEVAEFLGRGILLATMSTLGEPAEMLDYLKMPDESPT